MADPEDLGITNNFLEMLEQVCSGLREVTQSGLHIFLGTLTVRWVALQSCLPSMKNDGDLKEDKSSGLNKRQ